MGLNRFVSAKSTHESHTSKAVEQAKPVAVAAGRRSGGLNAAPIPRSPYGSGPSIGYRFRSMAASPIDLHCRVRGTGNYRGDHAAEGRWDQSSSSTRELIAPYVDAINITDRQRVPPRPTHGRGP